MLQIDKTSLFKHANAYLNDGAIHLTLFNHFIFALYLYILISSRKIRDTDNQLLKIIQCIYDNNILLGSWALWMNLGVVENNNGARKQCR